MSEWQPVRLAPASNDLLYHNPSPENPPLTMWPKMQGRIVFVRPIRDVEISEWFRNRGCTALNFYEMSPKDVERFFPDASGIHLCEHQIQAD